MFNQLSLLIIFGVLGYFNMPIVAILFALYLYFFHRELLEMGMGMEEGFNLQREKEMPTHKNVIIRNFLYKPDHLVVKKGTKVTFINTDQAEHTVTARDQTFNSGYLGKGEKWSHVFDRTGTHEYFCIPHPYMTGKIQVI